MLTVSASLPRRAVVGRLLARVGGARARSQLASSGGLGDESALTSSGTQKPRGLLSNEKVHGVWVCHSVLNLSKALALAIG